MHIFSWRGLRFTRFRFTPEVLNLVWFVKYLFAFTIFGGIDISIKMSNAYTSEKVTLSYRNYSMKAKTCSDDIKADKNYDMRIATNCSNYTLVE